MRRSPGLAFTAGAMGIVALLAIRLLAFHVNRVALIDRKVFDGFYDLHTSRIGGFADAFPHLSDPQPFVVFAVIMLAVALARGRPRLAVAVGAVLVGSNLTTHLLKPALAVHRFSGASKGVDAASWPSGHATASMALALCAIMVAPRWLRPLVAALGAVFSIAVCLTLLVDGWHFPSDVVAGYTMSATWTAFAVAAVWWLEDRRPSEAAPRALSLTATVAPALVVAISGVALFVLVTLARPREVVDYVHTHKAFAVGAGVIAALGLSLTTALSAALTSLRPSRSRGPTPDASPAPTAARRRDWPPAPR